MIRLPPILGKTPDSEGDIFAKGLLNGAKTGTGCGPTNQCVACGAGCVEAACLPAAEGLFLKNYFETILFYVRPLQNTVV